jgi:hypothetical protein
MDRNQKAELDAVEFDKENRREGQLQGVIEDTRLQDRGYTVSQPSLLASKSAMSQSQQSAYALSVFGVSRNARREKLLVQRQYALTDRGGGDKDSGDLLFVEVVCAQHYACTAVAAARDR